MPAVIRVYIYAAIAAALGLLIWREHHAVQRNKVLSAQLSQSQILDANKALDLERAKPLPRLQCRRVPGHSTTDMPSAATSSTVDSTAPEGHDGEADAGNTESFDPSAELMQFAIDAEQNENTLKACQAWVIAR